MRFKTMMMTVAAAALMATAAQAQAQSQEQGQYRRPLEKMITDAASGVCAADVMAAELLAACQSQIDGMAEGLSSLGAITSIRFVSAEGEGAARIETYAVTFAGGATLNWGIGNMVDGKFSTAYAGG